MDTYQDLNKRKDAIDRIERKQSAKALREVNKTFHGGFNSDRDEEVRIPWMFIICVLIAAIVAGCMLSTTAHAYTDEQIVGAIYKAEGGSRAKYLYGIRSVKYRDAKEARQICFNTVRNNRARYIRYGYRKHPSFIQFLGSRFCPVQGGNLTQSEKRLNPNWVKNVSFFLAREVR